MTNSTTPLANCDWPTLTTQLNDNGYAVTPPLLSTADCLELIALYDQSDPWRARVEPDKYRLGPGEYQHFAEPLPAVIADFREECYEHLVPIANDWHDKLGMQTRFPRHLKEFLDTCHLTARPNRPRRSTVTPSTTSSPCATHPAPTTRSRST